MSRFVQLRLRASTVLLLLFTLTGAVIVPDTLEQRLAAYSACHGERGMGNPKQPEIPNRTPCRLLLRR